MMKARYICILHNLFITTWNIDCIQEYLIENLSNYVQRVYGLTVTITVKSAKCVNFRAIYEVEIISASLAEVLPLLLNDLNDTEGLHLESSVLKLCSTECVEIQSTNLSNTQEMKIHPTHVILFILLISLTIILLILVMYAFYRLVIFKVFILQVTCFTIIVNKFLNHSSLITVIPHMYVAI